VVLHDIVPCRGSKVPATRSGDDRRRSARDDYNRWIVTKEEAAKRTVPAKKSMSEMHKAALAVGRDEGRIVRRYLEALEAQRSRPGRKRTLDSVQRQLEETISAIPLASPLDRVHLLQRRIDLQVELDELANAVAVDISGLEAAFIAALPGYSRRKHLTYTAWRQAGVPARVLRAGGIRRAVS
jgi:hypothetical protein